MKVNDNDIFSFFRKDLNENVLKIKNLAKTFSLPGSNENICALRSISLDDDSEFKPIKKGEFVMVRGPSGGGKTTLLNIIGSLDSDFEGELEILGNRITKECSDAFLSELRLKRIGFVFQSFNLISTMTALENVELPMTIDNQLSEKDKKVRATNLLARVGLEDRVDHLPSELSGGEMQRVAIARALSNKPDILLLDEPTGDLDSASTVEVMNLLLSINRFGPNNDGNNPATIVMVTHNPELECYADRILYFQDGVVDKQIYNETQIALTLEEYLAYINSNNE
jgi:putative ABC transport system ATP-binding protein